MTRAHWPLLWGAVVGAAVVSLALAWHDASSPQPSTDSGTSAAPDTAPGSELSGAAADSLEALVVLARRSPPAALNELGPLDGLSRESAIYVLAREFAEDDPISALAWIAEVQGELQFELRDAMLEQWALVDPAALVDYIVSIDSTRELVTLFGNSRQWTRTLAAAAPELALEAVRAIPDDFGTDLETFALRALAEVDPVRAIALVNDAADREERDRYATTVAMILGTDDPDSALEWLRGMDSPPWQVAGSVIGGIGRSDIERAVEILLTGDLLSNAQVERLSVTDPGLFPTSTLSRTADRIAAASDNPIAPYLMREIISAWAESDPDAAIAWILANDRELEGRPYQPGIRNGFSDSLAANQGWNLLELVADNLGGRDSEAAMSYVATLPEDRRGAWIEQVIGRAASLDPEGALALLEPFRGQAFFESTYRSIVNSAARNSPRLAANMLAVAPPQTRRLLIFTIAQRWTETDPAGARGWVMTLPTSDERDRGLGSILQELARSGDFDASLLSSFSSVEAMQRSLTGLVSTLAETRSDLARRVIDDYIEDEALRAQAESFFEDAVGRSR